MRADQFDFALPQPLSQRVAVLGFVGNHAHKLLPRSARTMSSRYRDRAEKIGTEYCALKTLPLLSIEQFRWVDRTELPKGGFREAARLPLFQILKSSRDLPSIS